jgi:hypothetical protein
MKVAELNRRNGSTGGLRQGAKGANEDAFVNCFVTRSEGNAGAVQLEQCRRGRN